MSVLTAAFGAAVGCSGADAPRADALHDGSAPEAGDGGAVPDGVPAPRSCAEDSGCPARHFCAARSRTCVSAVVEVAGGAHHSCARHEGGRVSCWGLAESIEGGGAAVLPPTDVPEAAGASTLAAGLNLTCGVFSGGTVRCWGNASSQVLREDGQPLGGATVVSLGADYGCAGGRDGVHCWGKNTYGELARPQTLGESAVALAAGPKPGTFVGTGIAAVSHDGRDRLCAWGRNATKMITGSDAEGTYREPQCWTVGAITALAVGDTHVCLQRPAAVPGTGMTLTCWGERYYGQLGVGADVPGGETADLPPDAAVPAKLGGSVAAVATGVSHTCALVDGGMVICFGRNHFGQVGAGANTADEEVRTPAVVGGLPGRPVALGGGPLAQHTCAIVEGGRVACWGNNRAGQLGDGPAGVLDGRASKTPVLVAF